MPAILRSVYNYKSKKTPRQAHVFLPNEEQLGYMRQLMKTGLKQHWPSYDGSPKRVIKSGLEKMDKFLEATGYSINPSFSSIIEGL